MRKTFPITRGFSHSIFLLQTVVILHRNTVFCDIEVFLIVTAALEDLLPLLVHLGRANRCDFAHALPDALAIGLYLTLYNIL